MGRLSRIWGNLLGPEHNIMWLSGGLAGIGLTHRFLLPETAPSFAIIIGILAGANIGAYYRNTGDLGREFDERDRSNVRTGMAWGYTAAIGLLGIELFTSISIAGTDVLLAMTSVAVIAVLASERIQALGGLR